MAKKKWLHYPQRIEATKEEDSPKGIDAGVYVIYKKDNIFVIVSYFCMSPAKKIMNFPSLDNFRVWLYLGEFKDMQICQF